MALAAIVDEKVEILLSLDSSSGSSSTQSDSRAAGLSAWPVMSRTGSTALPTPAERMQKSPARGAVQGLPDGTFWERGVQPAALSSSEISGRVTTEKTVEKNTPLEM